jgi:RimJ/RimL family protein N-acetyltransferase
MHRDHMGKGYAHEAINILIKHAFEVLNIHRIQINVVDKNIRAIKLYEKIGAVKEGVLREAFYLANKYHDVIVYSLLKQDYLRELKSDKRD